MFEKKIKLLEEVLGEYKTSGQEYIFWCPECKHHRPKFSINVAKNVAKCWVCDSSYKSLQRLIRRYGTIQQYNLWCSLEGITDLSTENIFEEKTKIEYIELPKNFLSLTQFKPLNPLTIPARHYLYERNVSVKDILWWKIGCCVDGEFKERIIIPSFDKKGNLNFFAGRSYTNHPLSYLYPSISKDIIFNEINLDWSKDVVLVEGIFDAIVIKNAIPLLGSTLREESYIFQTVVSKKKEIYIALDPDAYRKEDAIIDMFLSYGIQVYKIAVKPYKDVGEMGREIFLDRKQKAEYIETRFQKMIGRL